MYSFDKYAADARAAEATREQARAQALHDMEEKTIAQLEELGDNLVDAIVDAIEAREDFDRHEAKMALGDALAALMTKMMER